MTSQNIEKTLKTQKNPIKGQQSLLILDETLQLIITRTSVMPVLSF